MVQLLGSADGALDAAVAELLALPSGPPGVCLAVSSGARIHWSAGGVAQAFDDSGPIAAPAAFTPSTQVDLGSVTKIIATTLSLMVLVDRQAVRLTDRISSLLPWSVGAPIAGATLGQLLQHRAGLWEWWPTYLEPGSPLEVVSRLPLRYRPEAARHYSDLGFMLLGAVIAEVTGRPLDDAVAELVLRPLGLTETRYGAPLPGTVTAATSHGDAIEQEMVRSGVPYPVVVDASAFTGWRRHVLVGEVNDGNAFHSFGSVAGHAGLFSTARDLLRAGDELLRCRDGGGPIDARTVQDFFRAGPDPGQGLGFRRWTVGAGSVGVEAVGHTGFPGVAVAVLPAAQSTVVLVTNRLHVPGGPGPAESMWLTALEAAATQVNQYRT